MNPLGAVAGPCLSDEAGVHGGCQFVGRFAGAGHLSALLAELPARRSALDRRPRGPAGRPDAPLGAAAVSAHAVYDFGAGDRREGGGLRAPGLPELPPASAAGLFGDVAAVR